MTRSRLDLQRKMLLIILAVGLIPAIVGVALTAHELRSVIRDVAGKNLLAATRNMAGLLDREINDFISDASASVAAHPLTGGLFTEDESGATTTLTIVLSSLWEDSTTSRTVFLLPFIGRLQAYIVPPAPAPVTCCDPRPYRFLEQRQRQMPPGLTAVSVHTDPVLNRPVAVVWIPIPPGKPDSFRGWIGLELAIGQMLRKEASRALFGADSACILTSMGHLLGSIRLDHGQTARIFEQLATFEPGSEGRFKVSFEDGTKRPVAFCPLPLPRALRAYMRSDSDWYVCTTLDPRPLGETFRAQMSREILAGFALAVVLCLIAYRLSLRLTRPLAHLQEGVRRIAEGDLSSRVHIATGDEFQALAEAFNDMANRIQKTTSALQRQMETIKRQADELALLHKVTRAINAELDLKETLTTFASETARVVSFDRLSVALLDDDGEHFTVEFAFPDTGVSEFAPGTRHRLDDVDIGQAIERGEPLVRRDISASSGRPIDHALAAAGMKSVMVVPLISRSKPIGSLNLASRKSDAFGEEEVRWMANLAEPLAVAIQHSRLFSRVRRFAEDLEAEVRRRTTQLRRAQDKLVQTEKLAATGKLAAGIAHEINNPLAIIKNYLRLAEADLRNGPQPPQSATTLSHLRIIDEEISRIARIVKDLLDLYQQRDYSPAPTDLHDLIERVLQLFSPNWANRGIRIVRDFAPELPALMVSGDRMRQVFINLLRNAEDAIHGAGVVTISTRVEPPQDDSDSEKVVVVIEDTGCGIPPEHLSRIFDPFFTTKKNGSGTGLGLSVTYGIVRSYGGSVDVESQPGEGTRVTIKLPVVGPVQPPPSSRPSAQG